MKLSTGTITKIAAILMEFLGIFNILGISYFVIVVDVVYSP